MGFQDPGECPVHPLQGQLPRTSSKILGVAMTLLDLLLTRKQTGKANAWIRETILNMYVYVCGF